MEYANWSKERLIKENIKLRQRNDELEAALLEQKSIKENLPPAEEKYQLLKDIAHDIIVNNILDGIIIIDKQGRFRDLNRVSEQLIGKPLQEMKGKPISHIFEGQAPYTQRMLNQGRPYTDVETIIDTENGRSHILVSGVPIKNGQGPVRGGILFLRPMRRVQRLVNRFSGAHASFHFQDIIARNEEMLETIRIASLAAASMGNILLEGESGTGKELFAQAIHNRSNRSREPFVALNCGAIPRELVSSELFGYIEGAFTGSRRGGNPGKFELASGGTLFLDEIGDMPLEQQAALLRVLQEKNITRIGGDKVIPVDVRVICATNKNLWREVGRGNFRQDLYYRLNVIFIKIPPLRKRREDIPLLLQHFLAKLGSRKGDLSDYVEAEVLEYLQNYDWPGNVRELENVVERMLNIAGISRLCIEHLPLELLSPPSLNPLTEPLLVNGEKKGSNTRANKKELLMEMERKEILRLLHHYSGNISQVAREFGVARSTIYRKMKLFKIEN